MILWCPKYFTRLWCTYEVAVFHKLKPDAPVDLLPIYMHTVVFLVQLFYVGGYMCFLFVWPLMPGCWLGSAGNFMSMVPVFTGLSYASTTHTRQRLAMMKHLDEFDIQNAECYSLSDRTAIIGKIDEMYHRGTEGFNAYVRSELKEYVIRQFQNQRALLPYRLLILGASAPSVCFVLSTSLGHQHFEPEAQICFTIFVVTQCFALFPAATALTMWLGSIIPQPLLESRHRAVVLHLLVGAIGAFSISGSVIVAYILPVSIANGAQSLLPLDAWHGIALSVCTNGVIWLATAYWFLNLSGRQLRSLPGTLNSETLREQLGASVAKAVKGDGAECEAHQEVDA